MAANTPYESGKVTLASGDWLVIFTDGVTEAENSRAEEYDEARLMLVLFANQALSPPAMLTAIMQDLDRFVADAPQHDDIYSPAAESRLEDFTAARIPSDSIPALKRPEPPLQLPLCRGFLAPIEKTLASLRPGSELSNPALHGYRQRELVLRSPRLFPGRKLCSIPVRASFFKSR